MAVELGIAPRRLWGWEPSVVTTYEHDDEGRLVSSTATPEPEFNDIDLAMLAAWWEHKAETGQFGENLVEATSPDADPDNPQSTHRYVAGVAKGGQRLPLVNYAEKAVMDAQDARREAYPKENTNGHLWPVERIELTRR